MIWAQKKISSIYLSNYSIPQYITRKAFFYRQTWSFVKLFTCKKQNSIQTAGELSWDSTFILETFKPSDHQATERNTRSKVAKIYSI